MITRAGITSSTHCNVTTQAYVKGKKGDPIYINGEFESNAASQDGYYAHTEATQAFEKVRECQGHETCCFCACVLSCPVGPAVYPCANGSSEFRATVAVPVRRHLTLCFQTNGRSGTTRNGSRTSGSTAFTRASPSWAKSPSRWVSEVVCHAVWVVSVVEMLRVLQLMAVANLLRKCSNGPAPRSYPIRGHMAGLVFCSKRARASTYST